MKIAVLADIHSSQVAFQAALEHVHHWKPDQVILTGDLVNRGPRPMECLQLFQERESSQGWKIVRGNHEDYVIDVSSPELPHQGPVFEVNRASYWTYQHLKEDVAPLVAMPFQQSVYDPGGGELRVVHASMLGNREGIYPFTPDRELRARIQPPPAVLVVGHTHRALIRKIDETLVVNAGSVGLPFDGDTRLGYAQLTWRKSAGWQAKIIRLSYDLQAAEQDFYSTGYQPEAGPLVELVLIELRTARSMLFNWSARYQSLAKAGAISMEAAVQQFIREESGD